jgi:glucokinase
MDPGRIIVGGGLALAGEASFSPLRSAVALRCTLAHPPAVVPAGLGDAAGLLAPDSSPGTFWTLDGGRVRT